ncbi:MAG: hypothetical protein HC874_14260 [Richelia sp. SL_2_1]|nr:hypothetical protein [Richelia sp. SL_2_1]
MAQEQVLGFKINVEGITEVTDLRLSVAQAIQEIQKAAKEATNVEDFKKFNAEYIRLRAVQKEINAQVNESIKKKQAELDLGEQVTGQYRKLSAQLAVNRQRYKDLAAAEQESTDEAKELLKVIKQQDDRLKSIDASVGQFQRSVGNYGSAIGKGLREVFPLFGTLKDNLGEISEVTSRTGRNIARGFLAFQLVSQLAEGVKELKAFADEFNALRRTVSSYTDETGNALDETVSRAKAISDTFGEDINDVLVAANALSKSFGISTSDALDKIATGLLATGNLNGELLDQIKEYPEQFKSAGASADEFIAISIKATKEGIFSDKGVDLIKEFGLRIREQVTTTRDSLEGAFGKTFTDNIFKGINDGSLTTIEALKRVAKEINNTEIPTNKLQSVIANVFGAPGEDAGLRFIELLQDTQSSLEEVTAGFNEYQMQQQQVYESNLVLADAQNNVAKSFAGISTEATILSNNIKAGLLNTFASILDFFNQLPATTKGLGASLKVFFQDTLKGLPVAVAFGEASAKYREVFLKEFNKIEAADAIEADLKEAADATEKKRIEQEKLSKQLEAEAKKRQAEREREAKQAADRRKKDQENALKDQEKFLAESSMLIVQLGKNYLDEQIKLIADARQQALAGAKLASDQQIEQIDKTIATLKQKQVEQDAELVKAFGANSKQVLDFRAKAGKDLEVIEKQAAANRLAIQEGYRIQVQEINKRFDKEDSEKRLKAVSDQLSEAQKGLKLQLLQIEEARAKAPDEATKRQLEADAKVFEARKAAILKQQEILANSEADSFDDILIRRQELNTELAKLEEERTEKAKAESLKRSQALLDEAAQAFEFFQKGTEILSQFFEAEKERELKAYDERIQKQQDVVDNLDEQLQRATGVQKFQLSKQLKQEQDKLDKEKQAKIEAERDFAKRQRDIAIIQSIIQTALAVITALKNPPGPPFSTGQAIAAGIFGALQTATIAAQPLASGGRAIGDAVLSQSAVVPVALSDGRIVAAQNIPTLRNGDNVIATVKRGEVIVNERQQALLGGAKTFRAIGVPGFQDGGIIGAPIQAPYLNFAGKDAGTANFTEMIQALDRKTDAINSRLDNLRVFVVSEDVENDLKDRDRIQAKATLENVL